jgi:hypothetical protein
MVSSGMLRCVALVRTTLRNIPEGTILHSHRRENLKSYIATTPTSKNYFAICALWNCAHLHDLYTLTFITVNEICRYCDDRVLM